VLSPVLLGHGYSLFYFFFTNNNFLLKLPIAKTVTCHVILSVVRPVRRSKMDANSYIRQIVTVIDKECS